MGWLRALGGIYVRVLRSTAAFPGLVALVVRPKRQCLMRKNLSSHAANILSVRNERIRAVQDDVVEARITPWASWSQRFRGISCDLYTNPGSSGERRLPGLFKAFPNRQQNWGMLVWCVQFIRAE
jgi:hypothetical protein